MVRVIAVSNQKGGVGKTTTAINLASCLAMREQKVLLVDMDPQANASSGLGLNIDDEQDSSYQVIIGDCQMEEAILPTELQNLYIVPANQDLSGAEIELVSLIGREMKLKDALHPIKDDYDFIIIDTPPTLGLLTINALTAADSVLIPLQSEYYAMEGLSQLLTTTSLIKKRLNPNLEREGILLTMFDKRNNLSLQVESEVRKHFHNEVFNNVIPRNIKLSEAPSYGKPAVIYDVNSAGSIAYIKVCEEILAKHRAVKKYRPINKHTIKNLIRSDWQQGVLNA